MHHLTAEIQEMRERGIRDAGEALKGIAVQHKVVVRVGFKRLGQPDYETGESRASR